MTQYSIQILNQSGVPKYYVVTMETPGVGIQGRRATVYANAWATFDGLASGKSVTFDFDDMTYAYWAVSSTPLGPGVILGTGGVAPADVTQRPTIPFRVGPPTGFRPAVQNTANLDAYAISATTDFTPTNGYVFGLARLATSPIPTPVATFVAEPNNTFDIAPSRLIFVAEASCALGQVLDLEGRDDFATVDFTSLTQSTAVVTQGAAGWSVGYV